MHMSTMLLLAIAFWSQAILAWSGPTGHHHVPHHKAPHHWPGAPWTFPPGHSRHRVCHVKAAPSGGDSAPAIIDAFHRCGHNGKVVFDNTTYHVNSVMTTTGLSNCEIDIRGTLLWSDDIDYWLNHSLPVGYQNQSTAWILGGDKVHMYGHGFGTINGNGNVWYTNKIGSISNYPRRPHQITFAGLTNSVIERIVWLNAMMWTMTTIHSENVLLQDMYVSNRKDDGGVVFNTDCANTIYANNITFARWYCYNGDDGITWKANSSNVLVEDSDFYQGSGLAFGSIGQYPGMFEFIENITVRNIRFFNTWHAVWAKTWTGIQQGYPPNGGGAGIGYIKNILVEGLTLSDVQQLWYVTQCISFSGATGGCDTSKFQISDIKVTNVTGTITDEVASLQCSGSMPCFGMEISDVHLTNGDTGEKAETYLCSNVTDPTGFTCNGLPPQT